MSKILKYFVLSYLLVGDIAIAQSSNWPNTGGSGSGDVTGPGSSTDNAVTRFDGTGGKTLQNSGVLLDDSDNLSGINNLDVDGTADFSTQTTHMVLPGGTTAQRSGTTNGQFRFNSTTGYVEYYSTGWVALDGTGEANTGSNVGAGTGEVFKQKSALDLQFKTINGGNEITITNNASTIDIASDITLPGSSTDNAVPRFDSTTGKVLQGSSVIIDDSNNVTGVAALTASGLVDMTSTSHFEPAAGTTAQRPGTPAAGDCRYNTTDALFECYDGSAWDQMGAGGGGSQIDFETKTAAGENSTDASNVIQFTSVPTDKLVWISFGCTFTVEADNNYVYLTVDDGSEKHRCGVTDDDAAVTTGDSETTYDCMTAPFTPAAATINIKLYTSSATLGHCDDVYATIYVDNDSMYAVSTSY